mmetsp:Transcript_170576/g.547138  ORF Transcript_170576/g.547138 Transcript_170576/m.547138 type:complete len:260 (+) Transcript_170576:208-987(+)
MVETVVVVVAKMLVPMIQVETVHVPTILQQSRILQQMVELFAEVLAARFHEKVAHVPKNCIPVQLAQQLGMLLVEIQFPTLQEEIVPVPRFMKQERVMHLSVELVMDLHALLIQVEIVYAPRIIRLELNPLQMVDMVVVVRVPQSPGTVYQERLSLQFVESIVEDPVPMVQEELISVPKTVAQSRVQLLTDELTVEVPAPESQEEIMREFTIIQLFHFCVEGSAVVFVEQIIVHTRARPRRRAWLFLHVLLSGACFHCF